VGNAVALSTSPPGQLTYDGRYTGTVGGSLGGDTRGGEPADLDAKVAIAQCQEGNPKPAIPVLEQKLRDNRIPVPPRT